MKAKQVVGLAVLVGILVLVPVAALCQEKVSDTQWTQIVEQIGDKGRINWSEGYIEAVGIGAPPERSYGKPSARPLALRAAKLDAYRNLLEVTKGVRIDSSTTVRDFTVESDIINSQVEGIVRGAQIVGKDYLSDGTVEVTLRMPLAGSFAQVIIPKVIEKNVQKPPAPPAQVEQPVPVEPAAPSPAAPVPPVAPVAPDVKVAETPVPPAVLYTGLVVDARGIQARPAMAPRILDEQGAEVYGTASVERDYAVQQGMSGYARDLTSAQSNSRVTNNPLSVKGLKTQGPGRLDIVISSADAGLVRASAENASFLKKCRVMIVLD